MRIIYNNVIPFKGFAYLNFFGILFARKHLKGKLRKCDVNHEKIHTEQIKETLGIFFYLWYIIEWLIKIPFSWFYKQKYPKAVDNVAYKSISFEQEAYYNEYDYDYLSYRERFEWVKYIFKMYNPNREYPIQAEEVNSD